MSINTRNKRSGALLVGCPWRASLPLADGVIAEADRRQAAAMYPGTVTGAFVTGMIHINWTAAVPAVTVSAAAPAVILTGAIPSVSYTVER